MRCEDCRDAISARMDGEDPGAGPGSDVTAVEDHLAACAPCRAFADRAARITRLTRLRPAGDADGAPDLVPGLLAALDAGDARPAPPRERRALARSAVRAALAVLGVGQLALALSGIVATAGASHGPGRVAGAGIAHLSHESAAWNLALGVAFLWAASGAARRAGGLVPVIGAFVALLVALSALDLVSGHVDTGRLLGHVPVVAGLLLLLLHARLGHGGGGRTGAPEDGSGHADLRLGADPRHRSGDEHDDHDGYGGGLQPTAEHPAA
jgi:predicted anti-sigma-YlaC factor YlaD